MVKNVQNLVNIVCERPLKANPQSQASRGQSQMSLFFLHIFIRVRPRFFDQVGHQTTNASIRNKYFFIR